ncbi:ORF6N domain-containing protein [Desulfovibrio sp. OttesenSCG-928-M16]|nr:ORF6N domain-containing protein [Desulfovibrio sp. OttesenSCG-928-M16]
MTNDAVDAAFTLDTIVRRILEFRGQRVIMGSDLAILYGVEYRALIQAVKRNPERFPKDFMFQLSAEEWRILKSQTVISSLKSQIGTSKSSWGGSRSAPYAFTEHGALMLSSVLRSPRAVEISIMIIRAFVWLRQTVPAYQELAAKLMELESAVTRHDSDISMILDALRQLVTPPGEEKRRIGF